MHIEEMSETEFLFRVRHLDAFVELVNLLHGDEAAASAAMRAEIAFVRSHPSCPRGKQIATRVREYLVHESLEYSVPGIESAVRALGIA